MGSSPQKKQANRRPNPIKKHTHSHAEEANNMGSIEPVRNKASRVHGRTSQEQQQQSPSNMLQGVGTPAYERPVTPEFDHSHLRLGIGLSIGVTRRDKPIIPPLSPKRSYLERSKTEVPTTIVYRRQRVNSLADGPR